MVNVLFILFPCSSQMVLWLRKGELPRIVVRFVWYLSYIIQTIELGKSLLCTTSFVFPKDTKTLMTQVSMGPYYLRSSQLEQ